MMKNLLGVFFLLLLAGCFSSPQPDRWKSESAKAFERYKEHTLKGKKLLAKHELNQARSYAAEGGDFERMASVMLGACTLEKILYKKSSACKEYQELQSIHTSPKIASYDALVHKKYANVHIEALPKRYRTFAKALINKDFQAANKALKEQKNPQTMLVELYLLGTHSDDETLKTALQRFRMYGYKEAILYVLHVELTRSHSQRVKEKLKKEIAILKKSGEFE